MIEICCYLSLNLTFNVKCLQNYFELFNKFLNVVIFCIICEIEPRNVCPHKSILGIHFEVL